MSFQKDIFTASQQTADKLADHGRQTEFDRHQLITNQVSELGFATVLQVGEQLQAIDLNTVLSSNRPVPPELLLDLYQRGNPPVLGQVRLGVTSQDWFPATMRVDLNAGEPTLELYVVMVTQAMLEAGEHGRLTDGQLALAAAVVAAPQLLIGLAGGLQTEHCDNQDVVPATISPGHATPLVTVFESFSPALTQPATGALAVLTKERGDDVTLSTASHLHGHGLTDKSQQKVVAAASTAKLTAGVPVMKLSWAELQRQAGRFALFVPTQVEPTTGKVQLLSLVESMTKAGQVDFGLLAVALGFTSEVVGDSQREKKVEKILTLSEAETPLRVLVNG